MTRDEQIQQAEINYSVDTMFDGCDYIGQAAKQEAFIAGANWADDNPNWIRLIDEMPPIGVNVLTRVVKGDGSVVYQVDRRASYEWVNLCHYDKITHWMRIKFNEE